MSWDTSADALSGPGGYRESALGVGLTAAVEEPGSAVRQVRAFLERSSYGLSTSSDTTVTWTIGAGLDALDRLSLDLSLWNMSAPERLSDGAYRASGLDLGAAVRWDGLAPFAERPWPSFLRTEASLSWSNATHEEYFVSAPLTPSGRRQARRWLPIRQDGMGAGLTFRFLADTWIGAEVRHYRYDRDLAALARSLSFLGLFSTGHANTYDLILGFPDKSVALKAGQNLWSWGDVSVRWKKTRYVIGQSPESRTWALSLGVFPFRNVGVRARHEVVKADGRAADRYRGLGVEVGF